MIRKPNQNFKPTTSGLKKNQNLIDVRIIQTNLVYIYGLSETISSETTLRKYEYLGQYGNIKNLVINKTSPAVKADNSIGVYVSYSRVEEASLAILALDQFRFEKKVLRAFYGSSKYCISFINGIKCNNANCPYLHQITEGFMFQKDEKFFIDYRKIAMDFLRGKENIFKISNGVTTIFPSVNGTLNMIKMEMQNYKNKVQSADLPLLQKKSSENNNIKKDPVKEEGKKRKIKVLDTCNHTELTKEKAEESEKLPESPRLRSEKSSNNKTNNSLSGEDELSNSRKDSDDQSSSEKDNLVENNKNIWPELSTKPSSIERNGFDLKNEENVAESNDGQFKENQIQNASVEDEKYNNFSSPSQEGFLNSNDLRDFGEAEAQDFELEIQMENARDEVFEPKITAEEMNPASGDEEFEKLMRRVEADMHSQRFFKDSMTFTAEITMIQGNEKWSKSENIERKISGLVFPRNLLVNCKRVESIKGAVVIFPEIKFNEFVPKEYDNKNWDVIFSTNEVVNQKDSPSQSSDKQSTNKEVSPTLRRVKNFLENPNQNLSEGKETSSLSTNPSETDNKSNPLPFPFPIEQTQLEQLSTQPLVPQKQLVTFSSRPVNSLAKKKKSSMSFGLSENRFQGSTNENSMDGSQEKSDETTMEETPRKLKELCGTTVRTEAKRLTDEPLKSNSSRKGGEDFEAIFSINARVDFKIQGSAQNHSASTTAVSGASTTTTTTTATASVIEDRCSQELVFTSSSVNDESCSNYSKLSRQSLEFVFGSYYTQRSTQDEGSSRGEPSSGDKGLEEFSNSSYCNKNLRDKRMEYQYEKDSDPDNNVRNEEKYPHSYSYNKSNRTPTGNFKPKQYNGETSYNAYALGKNKYSSYSKTNNINRTKRRNYDKKSDKSNASKLYIELHT